MASGSGDGRSGGSQNAGCSVCGAAHALVIVEANGVATSRSSLCSACFSRRVREQRMHRVTPVAGVPITPLPERRR